MSVRGGSVLAAALLLMGGAALFFFRSAPAPDLSSYPNMPPRGARLAAFGDSLIEGVGSTRGGGFVSLLEERLNVPILNAGRAGDTTRDALRRLPALLKEEPDIVLVLLGGNDALRRVPPEETFENLRTIITRLQEEGAVVVVLGVSGGFFQKQYARGFTLLAKELRVPYIPNVLKGIVGRPELTADLVHPNDAGYARIADRVEPLLRALVARAQERP